MTGCFLLLELQSIVFTDGAGHVIYIIQSMVFHDTVDESFQTFLKMHQNWIRFTVLGGKKSHEY